MRRAEKRKEEESPKAEGLVFDWWHRQKAFFHIAIFLVLSGVLHVFGFYVFQVVYPPGGKVEPVPDRLTVLDPSDPEVHAMMGKLQDRVVFLRPASEDSDLRPSIDDYSIRFEPSYSNRKPDLKLRFPVEELGLTAPNPVPETREEN